MITRTDVTGKVSFSKNLISTQNYNYLDVRLNTAGVAFDATEGLGEAASNSSVVIMLVGGFVDQRVYGDFKYVSPTSQANSEIGVIARFTNPDYTGSITNASYLYARVDGGVAKLTKVVANTFTNLSTSNWALAQGDVATITLTCRGSAITATFYTAALGTLTLSATDSDILTGGVGGFRSLSSSIRARSIGMDQL